MSYFNEKNLLEMDPHSSKSDIKEGLAIPGNGKGDNRRAPHVTEEHVAKEWERIFGKKEQPEDCNQSL